MLHKAVNALKAHLEKSDLQVWKLEINKAVTKYVTKLEGSHET